MRRLSLLLLSGLLLAPSVGLAQEIYIGRDGMRYYDGPRGGDRYYSEDDDYDRGYSRRVGGCDQSLAMDKARRYGRPIKVGRTSNSRIEIIAVDRRGKRISIEFVNRPGCPFRRG